MRLRQQSMGRMTLRHISFGFLVDSVPELQASCYPLIEADSNCVVHHLPKHGKEFQCDRGRIVREPDSLDYSLVHTIGASTVFNRHHKDNARWAPVRVHLICKVLSSDASR